MDGLRWLLIWLFSILCENGFNGQPNEILEQRPEYPLLVHAPTLAAPAYRLILIQVYAREMDVAVTELRAHLSEWLERARGGTELVITDRGVPVARLLGLTTTAALERLTADGVIGRPAAAQRPRASGSARPRPRRPLAEIVSEQRR
jgi:prevent-host-death family protein